MAKTFQRPRGEDVGLDQSSKHGLIFVAFMAVFMWVSEVIDSGLGGDLDAYGIRPRELEGLEGVAFSPFLHGGWDHLIGNTIPFLILGATIALSGLARVVAVTAIVVVLGGLGTWLVSPGNSVIIGASGVVFGYAAYLIARWLYTRRLLHLLTGVIVLVVWGATLLSGFVPTPGVSWQAHLFGALAGLAAARLLDGRDRAKDIKARRAEPSGFLR
ncbi:MAG: rhomboid family intramembrane serine protease [Solirubrobacteraceae bacterium]|nr:rhomboid family intramembrane serine protease [Solirubrobacteraceae bacterium]